MAKKTELSYYCRSSQMEDIEDSFDDFLIITDYFTDVSVPQPSQKMLASEAKIADLQKTIETLQKEKEVEIYKNKSLSEKCEKLETDSELLRAEKQNIEDKLRVTLISLFKAKLKENEDRIKSNERLMKLLKKVSVLKTQLKFKEKMKSSGMMKGLDVSNVLESKRNRPKRFSQLKVKEKKISSEPNSLVRSPN